jgi:hypothetical protein
MDCASDYVLLGTHARIFSCARRWAHTKGRSSSSTRPRLPSRFIRVIDSNLRRTIRSLNGYRTQPHPGWTRAGIDVARRPTGARCRGACVSERGGLCFANRSPSGAFLRPRARVPFAFGFTRSADYAREKARRNAPTAKRSSTPRRDGGLLIARRGCPWRSGSFRLVQQMSQWRAI